MSGRGSRWMLALSLLTIVVTAIATGRVLASESDSPARAPVSTSGEAEIALKVNLEGLFKRAELLHEADGTLRWKLTLDDGSTELLSPDAFTQRLYQRKQDLKRSWLFAIFNVSSAAGLIWVSVGLLGQLLFTGRMLVQWLASEKSRRSVVPPLFWWLSLVGATMLLAYFIWRRDLVGVLGQAFGWIVYLRNIHLIYIGHQRVDASIDPGPEPELAAPTETGLPNGDEDRR